MPKIIYDCLGHKTKKGYGGSVCCGTDSFNIGVPESNFGEYATAAILILNDQYMRLTPDKLYALKKMIDDYIERDKWH